MKPTEISENAIFWQSFGNFTAGIWISRRKYVFKMLRILKEWRPYCMKQLINSALILTLTLSNMEKKKKKSKTLVWKTMHFHFFSFSYFLPLWKIILHLFSENKRQHICTFFFLKFNFLSLIFLPLQAPFLNIRQPKSNAKTFSQIL